MEKNNRLRILNILGGAKEGGLARSFMSMEFPFELGQESTAIVSSGRNAKHFAMIV